MDLPFFKKTKEPGVIDMNYTPAMCELVNLTEKFVGEVENENIKFPVKLGVKHPFDFKTLENLYKKFGFFSAVVDKYVDFVVGPGFYIECKDERAKKIIEDFMRDVNFDNILRQWTKEALIKGNGFLEIGGDKKNAIEGLKVLNANYMYVDRDKMGVITGYNQYVGEFKKNGNFDKTKIVPFKPKQIAHVPFNVVGAEAYGVGIGYPSMSSINNLLVQEQSMHMIMNRKANSPLHAKLGKVDGNTKIIPKPSDVTAFGKNMEIMHNKTDWATDPLVEFKVVDFGNIGDKYDKVLEYDLNMLIYCFQIPGVLLGMANIPEGLAGVQMEAFQRRIQSIQSELEKIIENKIFSRVLEANGFKDVEVEFEWGTPNVLEVEGRMALIKEMIASPMVNPALKTMLEDEMINLLKFDKSEWEMLKLEQQKKVEEERKRLEAQPQPIVPGQNKSFPQKVVPKAAQPAQPKPQEIVEPILKELDKTKTDMEKQLKEVNDEISKKMSASESKVELENKKIEIEKKFSNKQFKDDIIDSVNTKLDSINKEQKPMVISVDGSNNTKMKELESKITEQDERINEQKNKIKELEVKKDEKIDNLPDNDIKDMLKQLKNEMRELKAEKKELKKEVADIKKEQKTKIKVKRKRRVILKSSRKGLLSDKINKSSKIGENYEYKKACAHCTEGFDDINDISEWLGFSYDKYLNEILIALKKHDFEQIKAINEIQLQAGYLTDKQIVELRKIMDTGFKKGQSIAVMTKEVNKKVGLKDLYRMGEDGDIKIGASGLPILAKRAEKRGVAIVRSEITRVANQGAVKHYEKGGIQQVRWIASFGQRTCPTCEGLDNQIFEINSTPGIPAHPMCRCTLAPVVELK